MHKQFAVGFWVCLPCLFQRWILIQISDNFETASLPTTSPEDRKRLLSFVVCGGGPTGVETAAVSVHHLDMTHLNFGPGNI